MKGIDHLVLAGRDLEALRSACQAFGFAMMPRGGLPFGISNSVIPLQGSYLEILSVTGDVPEHSPGHFSFGAFNRDYLARHEGFSMLVFDTTDARADIASWREAGLQVYEPFDFSKTSTTPDGENVTLGFSLAFVNHPAAPWLRLFACEYKRRQFYAQPQYQNHPNAASTVQDVWIAGEAAPDLADFVSKVTGASSVRKSADLTVLQTRTGAIVLARPNAFEAAFGVPVPHPEDGPHLAGFTIGCRDLSHLASLDLRKTGDRYVVPPSKGFGTAIGFTELKRSS
jgi:glyoxalase-like protein